MSCKLKERMITVHTHVREKIYSDNFNNVKKKKETGMNLCREYKGNASEIWHKVTKVRIHCTKPLLRL